jgi:hypothetical protein
VIQKIYQHLAGYQTDDHVDDLSVEPLLTAILGKERLASQLTSSRCRVRHFYCSYRLTMIIIINNVKIDENPHAHPSAFQRQIFD